MDYIRAIEAEQINENLPKFNVGDTVSVHYRIIEGERQRIQVFDGTVLKFKEKALERLSQ